MATHSRTIIAVGTYEGVIAGWELDSNDRALKIVFASPVHNGSIRSLSMSTSKDGTPSALLSCGYDEYLKTHDLAKKLTSSGEIRTPADMGTPVCSAFCPPNGSHCMIGFSQGKIVIYKQKDWSIQHVLAGHEGGAAAMAVHPTGKMCLSGGESDGKLKLWDLTKGRLAYATKIIPAPTNVPGKVHYDAVTSIEWSDDGSCYAYCHGKHITVRDVASGKELLDIDLDTRVNQLCLMRVKEGLFVVAACNDGSLPVLAVQAVDEQEEVRRAIMAIEPVESHIAGEERFKCISHVVGYYVATANSAGVVSLMDLSGAVRMVLQDEGEDGDASVDSDDEEQDDRSENSEEAAVDIIDSVQLGSGARITCLVACSIDVPVGDSEEKIDELDDVSEKSGEDFKELLTSKGTKEDDARKRKREEDDNIRQAQHMDADSLQRARKLVADAKKIQQKKQKKKRRNNP